MSMAKVKNNLRQVLVLNADKDVFHFRSKEIKDIPETALEAPEVKKQIQNGNLLVIRLG